MLQNYNHLGVLSSILPFFFKNYQIWRFLVTIQPFDSMQRRKDAKFLFYSYLILLVGACALNKKLWFWSIGKDVVSLPFLRVLI